MHAAIKCLEDNLIIRRLQEREFEGGHGNAERLAALRNDIASLERGLKTLKADDGRQTTGNCRTDASPEKRTCGCAAPAIGNQAPPERFAQASQQSKIENS